MENGPADAGWCGDLLCAVEGKQGLDEVFGIIDAAARSLGFEYCAFGTRRPLPLTRAPVWLCSSYPTAWRQRYAQAGYVDVDPVVRHGVRSEAPQVWSDAFFAQAPQLWDEARAAGLRHGWAQSSLDCVGVGSLLTLSRSAEPLTASELAHKQARLRGLVQIAHVALGRALAAAEQAPPAALTEREKDILRLTASGMTAERIAARLLVSVHTVHFHLKNCAAKLQTANRPSMVARALVLRLLD
ncbi:autoinducer binding domain-containing protein [Pseudorhodoferax sp.]|uniref:autoinducer binding domain-containing protein n=1 Tax=Pseudorhodoferax sp. TaxID=1993553 RepID=UPI0039E512A4